MRSSAPLAESSRNPYAHIRAQVRRPRADKRAVDDGTGGQGDHGERGAEKLVDDVRDLPLTVSDVLAQVITECDNADASVSSLARIMAADQALAAMVLKLANSAYYGYARRIESLPDAVVLLGFASVKNLAITASITRLLATDKDELCADARRDLRPQPLHGRLQPASSAARAASRARRRSSRACSTTSA